MTPCVKKWNLISLSCLRVCREITPGLSTVIKSFKRVFDFLWENQFISFLKLIYQELKKITEKGYFFPQLADYNPKSIDLVNHKAVIVVDDDYLPILLL